MVVSMVSSAYSMTDWLMYSTGDVGWRLIVCGSGGNEMWRNHYNAFPDAYVCVKYSDDGGEMYSVLARRGIELYSFYRRYWRPSVFDEIFLIRYLTADIDDSGSTLTWHYH